MARLTSLPDAVASLISDGDSVAMEGFTHLIPHAAALEVVRQKKRNLTLIRMTPDLIYDQLIGMGCAKKLVFSWGGNPGVGSLPRFRDAIENGWPQPLEIEERTHADMACAYEAGAAGLPFAVLRGHIGTDLPRYNSAIKEVVCPFTGERLAAVPSIRPDVAVVHAQRADRDGNVHLWGIIGVQKEAVLAARKSIVTVEEIVDRLDTNPNSTILPHWVVTAVCKAPRGAHPSYAMGFSKRDNAAYKAWNVIARDRETFLEWMERRLAGMDSVAAFRAVPAEP